jgi:hypothetical protein
MNQPYKLNVEIGTSKFHAEGPEETVKEQFQQFLAVCKQTPVESPKSPAPPKPPINGNHADIPPTDILNAVYSTDNNGVVSLRVLPNTENRNADALLLLIYGFLVVGHLEAVPAGQLVDGVRQSGLPVDRVGRTIEQTLRDYVRSGGVRRGKRYSLNNQGRAKANELLAEMGG